MLERRLPRFAGLATTVVILIGAVVFGIARGDHADDVLGALSDTRNAAANAIGFRITSVAITGRKQLTRMRFSPSAASTAARRCCSSMPLRRATS